MKILVVDDENIVLDSCRKVLVSEGYDVCLVPSADKAIAAMEDDDFNLLLVDIMMPEHDGLYLMEEIKKRWPNKPVIVMSGYDTADTIKKAADQGSDGFINKPFTPDELINMIQKVLGGE
ncbi:MAG: response regulator [Deltaproteobacteria bacterium]|jgi:DNA-binding NtrC family response regulator|nr:response regulator [Deltaproteobacteria bacterium]